MRYVVHYVLIAFVSAKRKKIKEKDLQGFKYFKAISAMLENLHDAGCERDRANNRILHMDQYMSLILLYMFNPICSSLRAVQQASELKKVQRKLGCPRASLGSLSEAARVFDSKHMEEIVKNLGDKLKPISTNTKLNDINGIELETYAAIIACMLIALWTGRKPTLRTYEMLCWYFTGVADEEELLAHINRLQTQA